MLQKSNNPPCTNTLTYLIIGEDEFRKRSYLDTLKAKLLKDSADIFNYNLYYAKDAKAADIIDFLETFSMASMGRGRKMAVLVEPETLAPEESRQLVLFIKKARRENIFLVMIGGKSSAKLDNFAKVLPENISKIDVSPGRESDISAWVVKEFDKRNKQINRKSALLIAGHIKQDIGRVVSVIDQVSLFTGSRQHITDDDIMLFLDMPPESSAFLLIDAINEKKPDRAILILEELLRTETSPVQMVGFLAWHIMRFVRLKSMLLRRASRADMLSGLKVNSYRLDKLIAQVKQFSLARLRQDLKALADADLLIKTSNIRDDYLLEALVVKLAS